MKKQEILSEIQGGLNNILSMLEAIDVKLSLLAAEQNELKWLIEKEVKK
jgi:hypothetical protein